MPSDFLRLSLQSPPIDVLVSTAGSWNTVRVAQPFDGLIKRGWDVQIHYLPFKPHQIRNQSLVIWQRPLPESRSEWQGNLRILRSKGCLVILEWDDHPDLFPERIKQTLQRCRYVQFQQVHAIQCSSIRLSQSLKQWHPMPLVVENGVEPIPSFEEQKHISKGPVRVLLGSINRYSEHQKLLPQLLKWLREDSSIQLVYIAVGGLDSLPEHPRVETWPLLSYDEYRQLLHSCHLTLLPLHRGEAQACKTAIKWMEAAAESTVCVAGPELYQDWITDGETGRIVTALEAIVPIARGLAEKPLERKRLAQNAHFIAHQYSLSQHLPWRDELYQHLWRLRHKLDAMLVQRWPELQTDTHP